MASNNNSLQQFYPNAVLTGTVFSSGSMACSEEAAFVSAIHIKDKESNSVLWR